jgi:ribosomal protein S18 acetylase RimI-like enzyme
MTFRIHPAETPEDIAAARGLFRAYVDSLAIDLGFQDVEAELATLPGKYAPPGGAILLARDADGRAVGCVALRPLDSGTCEMKRLYALPRTRGTGLGRRLAEAILAEARRAGYRRILLDTLDSMAAARGLYAALGFAETAAYYANPTPGTVYLARDL